MDSLSKAFRGANKNEVSNLKATLIKINVILSFLKICAHLGPLTVSPHFTSLTSFARLTMRGFEESSLSGLGLPGVREGHHAAHFRRRSTRKLERRMDVITLCIPTRLPRLHLHPETEEGRAQGCQERRAEGVDRIPDEEDRHYISCTYNVCGNSVFLHV